VVALFLLGGVARGQMNPWRDNLTKDQVEQVMGLPKSTVQMGAREFLDYDGGVRIELRNGVVDDIEGPVPAGLRTGAAVVPASVAPTAAPASGSSAVVTVTSGTGAAPAAPVVAPVAATATVAAAPVAAPVGASSAGTSSAPVGGGGGVAGGVKPVASAAPVAAAAPASGGSGGGGAAVAKGDADGALVNEAENPTLPPEAAHLLQSAGIQGNGSVEVPGMGKVDLGALTGGAAPKQNAWVAFAIGLGTSTLFLSVVLKVAFMKKDFPVIWRDVVLVAFVTALFYQGMYSLLEGNSFYDIFHMLQGDWMFAGALMLWLIVTFTEAKNFATAAKITVASVSLAAIGQFVVAAVMF
jgi:hypothetical protein